MKRFTGGKRTNWAQALAKHKFVSLLSIALLATGVAFIVPHFAKADPHPTPASAEWLNREYLKDNDGHNFFDNNTWDTTYEYVQQTAEACPNKLIFKVKSGAQGTEPLNNIFFYYNTDTYNDKFKKIIATGNPGVDPTRGFATCTYAEKEIPVSNGDNRRITWVRQGDRITNIMNTTRVFVQKTPFKNIDRFYNESEVGDSSNNCPDILLLHRANPTAAAESVFGRGDVEDSAMLYSVQQNDDLARTSESYNTISEPNGDRVGPGTCHIRGSAIDHKKSNDYPMFSSGSVDDDAWFTVAGLDSNGATAPNNSDFKDDAFITFIGDESNLPKDGAGATIPPNTDPAKKADDGKVDTQTCKGGAMGWVICPVVSAIQTIADLLKNLMAGMLAVSPLPVDTSKEIYVIWNNIRNFANIAFVIVFFVIIFSQATSIGISNYGIKKLLPNLIAVAIATNLSYYVCAALIDVFNVLGVGVYNLVAIVNGGAQGTVQIENGAGAVLAGVGIAAAGAAFYTGAVVQLLPLLVAAIIGLGITFIVLVIRQAAIIILVVIAPLAFVAGILPGTRSWLSKWANTFIALLLMYPLVMLLFAGARLAGSILTATSPSGVMGMLVDIVALVLQIVLGFAAIFLFKWALVAKGALGKVAGGLNNATKGLTGRAKEYGENTGFFQRRKKAGETRQQERARRNLTNYAQAINPDANAGRIQRARAALLRRRAAGGLTGQVFGTNQAGQARAQQTAEEFLYKQRMEEANRASRRMAASGFGGDTDYERIASAAEGTTLTSNTGQTMLVTAADRQAAMNKLAETGRVSPLRRLEAFSATATQANPNNVARGAHGAPQTEMQRMLDDAYKEYGAKLGSKAPDLIPDRRSTDGYAAFTSVNPSDASQWHHSTIGAARNYYNNPQAAPDGAPVNVNQERSQTLRSFSTASQSPATRQNIDIDQATQMRAMMQEAQAAGTDLPQNVIDNINDIYTHLGGRANP